MSKFIGTIDMRRMAARRREKRSTKAFQVFYLILAALIVFTAIGLISRGAPSSGGEIGAAIGSLY